MQSTRQHIIDYISQNHSASAMELSRAFGMTPANIRHHMHTLVTQGQITELKATNQSGRGRPEKRFALSAGRHHPALLALSAALLEQMEKPRLSRYPATRIKGLARKILGPIAKARGSLSQRLVDVVRRFEELGYRPTWEATPKGPQIIFNVCPFAEIIEQHPELCRMDSLALEIAVDEKFELVDKLAINAEGVTFCRFRLKN